MLFLFKQSDASLGKYPNELYLIGGIAWLRQDTQRFFSNVRVIVHANQTSRCLFNSKKAQLIDFFNE